MIIKRYRPWLIDTVQSRRFRKKTVPRRYQSREKTVPRRYQSGIGGSPRVPPPDDFLLEKYRSAGYRFWSKNRSAAPKSTGIGAAERFLDQKRYPAERNQLSCGGTMERYRCRGTAGVCVSMPEFRVLPIFQFQSCTELTIPISILLPIFRFPKRKVSNRIVLVTCRYLCLK